jgi:uncharacterized protein YgiM (DUF1202 family)
MKKFNELLQKKTTRYVLFGLPILVGGYFIYRELRGRQKYKEDVKAKSNLDLPDNTPTLVPEKKSFGKYAVSTLGGNLNIRKNPSTSSDIVGVLPNGEIINATPSTTTNWYEYSKDGSNVTGFVSGTYLKKV